MGGLLRNMISARDKLFFSIYDVYWSTPHALSIVSYRLVGIYYEVWICLQYSTI